MHPSVIPGLRALSVSVPSTDIHASLSFYSDELGYFERTDRWGEGWAALRASLDRGRCETYLMVSCDLKPVAVDQPLLWIAVNDVRSEFRRIASIGRSTGGRLISDDIFEYPLASFFNLADPCGNIIQVECDRGLPA